MVFTVIDQKKKNIDYDSGKGYTVYLKKGSEEEMARVRLSKTEFGGAANNLLKLNITPDESIGQFEELYAKYPVFKEDNSYMSYLFLKCRKDSTIKPEATTYAAGLIKKGDERSLMNADIIYQWLEMPEKFHELDSIAVRKYPKGQFARNDFYNEYYKPPVKTEKYTLDEMDKFTREFGDSSYNARLSFFTELLKVYVKNEDTLHIRKYASLIKDKMTIASVYNEQAWQLSGQDLVSQGTDLPYAESLSKQSIEMIKEAMSPPSNESDAPRLKAAYIMYADTYALISYKQKNYDRAFQYQDEISRMDDIDTGGKERYACYAEKAKGPEFAKSYIEEEINGGVESKILLNQLLEIYKKLNLPLSDYERIKGNSEQLTNKKVKDEIIKKYGGLKAIDFTLTNMQGENVQLSDLKGKMVVLDFWATWCGPCRASFPQMQELEKKYQNKAGIEFLFIDVWERKSPSDTKKNTEKFIQDNQYSFNVLYDFKDEVATKYKINSIPSRILIDKNGDILSIESSIEGLTDLIAKNI